MKVLGFPNYEGTKLEILMGSGLIILLAIFTIAVIYCMVFGLDCPLKCWG